MLFLFIAGASASGKTEVANKVVEILNENKIKTATLSMDHYYKSQQERGGVIEINFDIPEACNWELLENQLKMLSEGQIINRPTYCFLAKDRLPTTQTINPKDVQVVVVEGILALHNVTNLNLVNKLAIFVETNSYRSILARRKERDQQFRATSPEETAARERKTVGPAFFRYIAPSKANADLTVTNNDSDVVVNEQLPINSGVKNGIEKAAEEIIDKIRETHAQLFPAAKIATI
ncbi:uridine kinase family protein [Legionella jamestowniensis]|uniref:Uridine kinase n=1 Tax=Legionella jamestowniensis TaxID=455 RepID=A0A0W0UJJ8_9GAMM|nr:hypothetical protein [Legionella jamestowniensis]KTD08075.1 uridine kinase [Legionella jamestowniensis]OCH97354.1 hypothetical protein A8135_03615 [Legionella jamestowniensis]SFM05635.1 uridine kinase [Legionella jamestowniensis DSM 19215]